ncbi:hypothetical protein N0V82_004343 [Gnomoniopsis sp. IMI 355080]|nr:hypothetical protein N0V82_004343 [Gnomoniopsis sp. IMI 355080]
MADFLGDPNFPNKAMKSNRGVRIRYFQDLYKTYSRLHFSRISDRPFAITGIESRLRRAYSTEGGWGIFDDGTGRGFLHRSLLWRRGHDESPDGMARFQMPTGRNGGRGEVPSWSWMGRSGGIDYLDPAFAQTQWMDIAGPWSSRDGVGASSERSTHPEANNTSPRSGINNTMELIAGVREYDVRGRRKDEVDLVFDEEQRVQSDGAVRTRHWCLVVAKEYQGRNSKPTDAEMMHYILIVDPDEHGLEKTAGKVYRRIGAGKMLGKFIFASEEKARIR